MLGIILIFMALPLAAKVSVFSVSFSIIRTQSFNIFSPVTPVVLRLTLFGNHWSAQNLESDIVTSVRVPFGYMSPWVGVQLEGPAL